MSGQAGRNAPGRPLSETPKRLTLRLILALVGAALVLVSIGTVLIWASGDSETPSAAVSATPPATAVASPELGAFTAAEWEYLTEIAASQKSFADAWVIIADMGNYHAADEQEKLALAEALDTVEAEYERWQGHEAPSPRFEHLAGLWEGEVSHQTETAFAMAEAYESRDMERLREAQELADARLALARASAAELEKLKAQADH